MFLFTKKEVDKKTREAKVTQQVEQPPILVEEIEEPLIVEVPEIEEVEPPPVVPEKIPFKEIKVINEYLTVKNNVIRKSPPDFMQGLYVTAYKTQRQSFDSLLEDAKNSGINTIVFDVKEMQGHVYFSIKDAEQLKYTFAEPIFNINNIVAKIHSYGFYAVARIVQFYNIETATHHPELQIKNKEGGYWQEKAGKPAWLDPSNPLVQNELLQIIDIVAATNVDEIQLDYVRFPTEGNMGNSVFYFREIDALKAKQDTEYKRREKRDIIKEYVRQVRAVVDRHKVKISADIFAIVAWQRDADIRSTGQDISLISQHLHHLHPMIYSSHFTPDFQFNPPDFIKKPYHIVKYCLDQTVKNSDKNCRVIPFLQAFGWKVDYTKSYVFDQLKATVDAGCGGYIFWNANSNYDKTLEWVKEWNIARNEGTILDGYYKESEKTEKDLPPIQKPETLVDIEEKDETPAEVEVPLETEGDDQTPAEVEPPLEIEADDDIPAEIGTE